MKSASLIILTYNNTRFLKYVLKSAFNQSYKLTEIIVADDGSKEDTFNLVKEMVKSCPFKLKHVWHADTGFRIARSRNNAASVATGDVLIFVDGDILMHPHFVADHVAESDNSRMLQGSRVLLTPEITEEITSREKLNLPGAFSKGILSNRIQALRSKILAKFHRSSQDYMKGTRGCNMSVMKETYLKINGFDNRFEGWGREDSEFVARLLNASIHRQKIKNMAVAFHMYHPEAARESLEANHKLLMETVNKKLKVTDFGVKQVGDFKVYEYDPILS